MLYADDDHKVHYKMYVSDFEIRIDVIIDGLNWIYNCIIEKSHKEAFNYLEWMELKLRDRAME